MTTDELKKQGRGGGIVTFDFQSFAGAYIEDLRRTLSEMPIEELEKLRAQPMDVLIEYDQGERGDAWDRYG